MSRATQPPAPEFLDVRDWQPPKGVHLVLLSAYGVVSVGPYLPGFHVGWLPLPRAPRQGKKPAEVRS